MEDLDLFSGLMRGALGRLAFTLRELPTLAAMELLVAAVDPLPAAKAVLRLVGEAVAHMMPSLRFALAVPARGGGGTSDADGPLQGGTNGERELVLLDGAQGLEVRLSQAGNVDVPIGRGRLLSGLEARRLFEVWLPQAGQAAWYDAVVLCGRGEPADSRLATAVAGRLSSSVVGLRGVRVFVGDGQVSCLTALPYVQNYILIV